MHKAVLSIAALALPVAASLAAQEDRPVAFIGEAYYSVDMAYTEEWTRQYREYSVPVLRQLVDEGVIEGLTRMQHQTGGDDYRYRFAVRTCDRASVNVFWREYLERLRAAEPVDEMGWAAEGGDLSHMYASTFRVNLDDMAEWRASWDDM